MHLPRVGQQTDEISASLPGWILASIGGTAILAVVWTVCACCRISKKGAHDEATQVEGKRGEKAVGEKKQRDGKASPNSETSFATVYAMQIPQRVGKGKLEEKPTVNASPSRSMHERSESKAAPPKASVLFGGSKRPSSMSTMFPSKRSGSMMQRSKSVERSNASMAASRSVSRAELSRAKSSSGKVPVQMMAVIMISLFVSSATAKQFFNENVADIVLAIRYCTNVTDDSLPARMCQLLNGIGDWPISEAHLRVGVGQGAAKILLNIANGTTPQAVKEALKQTQPDTTGDRQECLKVFPSVQEMFAWNASGRTAAPTVYVAVLVLRMDDSDRQINSSGCQSVFSRVVTQKTNYADADVVLVLEIGHSRQQYGIFEKVNGSACYYNDSLVAEKLLATIRRLLATCPLEVVDQCINGKCVSNVTVMGKPGDNRYCWSIKQIECGKVACQEPSKEGTSDAQWRRGPKSWTYLGLCLASILIASIVAVVASVRQCVRHVRRRQQQKQQLADYGMIGVKKKRADGKSADVAKMMTVMPATLGETRMPSPES